MISVRKGEVKDLEAIYKLIKELASYENAAFEVETSVESMKKHGFGENVFFEFLVAEFNNEIVGTAVFFYTYSTWKGPVLYLEDLVVSEFYRRNGIGKMLFDELAALAKEKNVKRISWQVLDWNEPAIAFYNKIGATLDAEWINCKLSYEQIKNYNEK